MSRAALAPEIETGRELGARLHARVAELFPICRSITGEGVRETLRRLQALIPLEIHEVPSGTAVFDWTVPREWTIREAYVADSQGTRVIDFRRHNLHVVSYSVPVRARMRLTELRAHLHSDPASIQTGFPTARATTARPGASVCLTASSRHCPKTNTRS